MIIDNKTINAKCVCGSGLPWVKKEVVMIDPCEHLIHLSCLKNSQSCPFCNTTIERLIRANDFKYNKSLYQKCIDIISVSNFDNMSKIYSDQVILNLPNLLGTLAQIPFIKGVNNARHLCEDIFSMNNIKIKVRGLNKLKDGPKIFIANHTSHLDFLTIFYVLKTGFLTSSSINDNIISKQFLNILPLLVVERGKGNGNTVDKMKEYVEKKGSICLFPEGMLTHPDTIIKFRTGAFHIGYPIYPIVLKYKIVVSDMSAENFILKISSHQEEIIEMFILDPFYPPFDENKIEMIRCAMANRGNMLLSRVSNRDIKD
jgi:1-acyl-sn-glycerol-3-phosphate acyltransferase